MSDPTSAAGQTKAQYGDEERPESDPALRQHPSVRTENHGDTVFVLCEKLVIPVDVTYPQPDACYTSNARSDWRCSIAEATLGLGEKVE